MDLDLVSDTDLEKKLFLFRFATLEKWETHFCQRWHLIVLHICVTILSKCQNVTWFKDLFFIIILEPLNISGQNSKTFSCVANFDEIGKWSRKRSDEFFWIFTSVPRKLGFSQKTIGNIMNDMNEIHCDLLWSTAIHCDSMWSTVIHSDTMW